MVYESRVGDVFALGATSWRIEDITHDRVLVSPAFGQPGRVPFWKGDGLGRPAELGAAIGAFIREVSTSHPDAALERVRAGGLDERAVNNLVAFIADQKAATGHVPTDTTLVVERFRDELGDWRVILHSPYGMPVHSPWALAVTARVRERFGYDGSAVAADDGIIVRLPDTDAEPPGAELFVFEPAELEQLVTDEVGGSALFASRFRECAARALLLPRYNPGTRSPLWQQRQRAAQLLEVARRYPTFPIVLETVREVLQDVYDLPALMDLTARIANRGVRIVETEDRVGVALRAVAAVRLRRRVHVRGRLAPRRASRRGPEPRRDAARGAPRAGGVAGAPRPPGSRADRARTATAGAGPQGPRPRGGRRPAARARTALRRRARRETGGP